MIASMSADAFWGVLRRHEPASAAMLRRLTRIARGHLQRVVEFSTLPVRSRVHAELMRLTRINPGPNRMTAVITPAPTHAAIASRISTHREAVSRELSELARAGLIEKRGNALIIRDVAALARMVEETLEESSDPSDPNGLMDRRGWSSDSAVPNVRPLRVAGSGARGR